MDRTGEAAGFMVLIAAGALPERRRGRFGLRSAAAGGGLKRASMGNTAAWFHSTVGSRLAATRFSEGCTFLLLCQKKLGLALERGETPM